MNAIVHDHHDAPHEVEIPPGFFQVHGWPAQHAIADDLFLDINELTRGQIVWRGFEPNSPHFEPRIFACLIRKIPGPELYQGANI